MPDLPGFVLTRSIAVLLHVLGYRRTSAMLGTVSGTDSGRKRCLTPLARAEEVVRRIEAAATAGPLPVGCLPRALAVRTILAREGIDAAVRIGVRREGPSLKAHAWVEHDRAPVLEPEGVVAGFAAFDHDFA
jgi:hypothetical protein